MPILSVKHVTTYRYQQPVAFGEHRMMLRPRDDDDQKVLQSKLEISPTPRKLTWGRDKLGNHVAIAHFANRSDELRVVSIVCLEHTPNVFQEFDVKDYARTYPFRYRVEDWSRLRRFILRPLLQPELRRWSDQFFGKDGSANLHALLINMTQTIRRTFRHLARHEKGIQEPGRTIAVGSGSCRDLAVLMIAALRSRGIAARFVSGYVHLSERDEGIDHLAGGNTHAWVQVYVPGPGWVDFDPSAGVVGSHNLIRVAAVQHPRDAIPLQGTWYGSASDHLAMQVAVRVKASLNDGTFVGSILD